MPIIIDSEDDAMILNMSLILKKIPIKLEESIKETEEIIQLSKKNSNYLSQRKEYGKISLINMIFNSIENFSSVECAINLIKKS